MKTVRIAKVCLTLVVVSICKSGIAVNLRQLEKEFRTSVVSEAVEVGKETKALRISAVKSGDVQTSDILKLKQESFKNKVKCFLAYLDDKNNTEKSVPQGAFGCCAEHMKPFNRFVISNGYALLDQFKVKIELAKLENKAHLYTLLTDKMNNLKLALNQFLTMETIPDSYEIVVKDPVLKEKLYEQLNIKEGQKLLFKDVKDIKKLVITSPQSKFRDNTFPKVIDISPIRFFVSLVVAKFSFNNIEDISALSELKELREIDFYFNKVHDVSPLANLHKLENVCFWANDVSGTEGFRNLKNLREVNLGGNEKVDINDFLNSPKLESIWLNSTHTVLNLESLSKYKYAHCIKKLGISGCKVSSIKFAASLVNLNSLVAENNLITDISPLASLKNLNSLLLSSNSVSGLKPLEQMVNNGCFSGRSAFSSSIKITNNFIDLKPMSANRIILDRILKKVSKVEWKKGNVIQ